MKIKNYDTPTACKKNYYFSEKKKGYCFFARLFKYSKIIAVKTATFLTQSR